jgi:hypothetical protein
MESIFTDESDIWSEDRELRAPPPPVSPSAMRKTLNLDKSTRSFQISEELTSVLVVREIVNADGKIKELHDLTLEDMSEILDEIKSEELNEDEFQELAYARSEIEPELVTALKFLEQAVQSIDFDPDWTNAYIENGFDRIIKRVRESDNLSLSKKVAVFEELTGTEDNWFSPICGVTMALLWNLPEQSMDECIMRYAKLRGESHYEDDPWSSDPNNNDYRHWMPLLVLAALGSSGSQKIMKVIDQTCNTSSAMPFWMLICVLTMYFTDPESFDSEESENGDWFPENYWQECIFNKEYQGIKINNDSLGELISLYVSRVGEWIWTNCYNLTQDEIDNYLVKITSD